MPDLRRHDDSLMYTMEKERMENEVIRVFSQAQFYVLKPPQLFVNTGIHQELRGFWKK